MSFLKEQHFFKLQFQGGRRPHKNVFTTFCYPPSPPLGGREWFQHGVLIVALSDPLGGQQDCIATRGHCGPKATKLIIIA